MTNLRAYAALTAVPALLAFGSGTAAAHSADVPTGHLARPEILPAAADSGSPRPVSESVQLPEGIDPQLRDQAQSYLDGVQQQITTAFNGIGFPSNESDRRNASTVTGGVLGAVIGKVAVFPLEIVGCGVGAAVGAVAGGVIGALPTVGAGAPVGAAVGGVAGCLLGGLAVAIPVDIVGLVGGAVIGGAAGGALGAGVDAPPANAVSADAVPADAVPANAVPANAAAASASVPLLNTQAPQTDPLTLQPVAAVSEAFAAISPDTKSAVTSLRTAIASMSPLSPGVLGPLTQPANDLLAVAQSAF
ncbi:hypothetical protein [Nocardia sp. NBC_01327]|uniref:hypothetical protein n=1 Tax=Nocardia sp. NBC_01327 TaxID=2903593 RepID=UPI002E144185|nr:hypothetical protein OG326_15605 [Nocardia sp. NBC_01327]